MSDPPGRLKIQLRRTPRGIAAEIDSTRPRNAVAAFAGRTPQATAALLPQLFSVCSKAQSKACVTALDLACGFTPAPRVEAIRELSVAAETIREHLWRLLLDWPRLMDEPADRVAMASVLSWFKDLSAGLDPDGSLFRPGAGEGKANTRLCDPLLADIDGLIALRLLGMPSAQWLEEVTDGEGFIRWVETTATPAARLLRRLALSGEAALGGSAVTRLPEITDRDLVARLGASDAAGFLALPTWDGAPRETSPLTRRADCGLMRDLTAIHGNGLLPRLAAQPLEVAFLVSRARSLLATQAPEQPDPMAPEPGLGVGRSDAARGLLIHVARVDEGQVMDYRILAPTEWNFHPRGAVAQGLAALPDAEDGVLRRRAESLIMATDPCVAFELSLVSSSGLN